MKSSIYNNTNYKYFLTHTYKGFFFFKPSDTHSLLDKIVYILPSVLSTNQRHFNQMT